MAHYIVVNTNAGDAFAEGQVERTSKDMIRVCVSGNRSSVRVYGTEVVHSPFTRCEVDGSTGKEK
jgi:hypothetical protein